MSKKKPGNSKVKFSFIFEKNGCGKKSTNSDSALKRVIIAVIAGLIVAILTHIFLG